METKLEKPGSDGSGVSRGAIFATLDKAEYVAARHEENRKNTERFMEVVKEGAREKALWQLLKGTAESRTRR